MSRPQSIDIGTRRFTFSDGHWREQPTGRIVPDTQIAKLIHGEEPRTRCVATGLNGERCKFWSLPGSPFCGVHGGRRPQSA